MNLYQLKVFYFASKYESLSKAADKLCITQPAITKQIQQLHNYYGIKFLNRFGKRMVLTDAGRALYSTAEKIFDMENQAEESIRDFQQLKSGHIKIFSSESFGAYYLPSIIIPFNKIYPNIMVSVNIFPVEEVINNTIKLNCDIGFVSYAKQDPKLVVKEILEDDLVLIVPPSHPYAQKDYFSVEDLEGESIIMHESNSATRRIVDNFLNKHNISVKIKFELSNNEAIKRSVEKGIGISIVSKEIAKEEITSKRLIAIPGRDKSLKRKYYIIHHKDKYFSKPLRGLMDMTFNWASKNY